MIDFTKYDNIFETIENSSLLTDLLDKIPSGLLLVDNNKKIKFINDRALEILGFDREELIGESCLKFACDPCISLCGLNSENISKPIHNRICTIKTKQGDIRTIEKNLNEIFDKQGVKIGGFESFDDITNQISIENELKESKELFEKITTSAKDAIVVFNDAEKIVFWNTAAESIFGYTKAEALELDFQNTFSSNNFNIHQKTEWLSHFKMSGEASSLGKTLEYESKRKNGEIFPVEISLSSVKINEKWNIVAIIRDISERKKDEQKMRILSKAIEASSSSVVITDPKGIIRYVNPYFEKLTGYTKEEAYGNNPSILKSGEQTKEYYEELWKTLSKGDQWKGEFHNKKKNGEAYWELATISPILNDKKEITHFVAVKDDITNRKNSELFKTRLISIIGHDLRGVFLNISGFGNMLKKSLDADADPKLITSVSHILKTVNWGSDLLENLVNWAKIKAHVMELKPTNHILFYSVDNTINQLTSCCNNKDIKIENQILKNIKFDFDEIMLNTVVRNIISNSIKFTNKGGQIKINAKQEDDIVEINISDNGVGMNKQILQDLFSTNKSSTTLGTNKEKGTGLGLKICYDLVKIMNGKIKVKSVENQGTTFSILLNVK